MQEILGNLVRVTSFMLFAFLSIVLVYRLLQEVHIIKKRKLTGEKQGAEQSCLLRNKNLRLFLSILLMVVVSRIAIYVIAYFGLIFFKGQNPGFFASFEMLWKRWDSEHYLFIAQHGYSSILNKGFLIAFPPAYPLLVKIAQLIVRNYFLSGLVVSHLSLTAACFLLYKLVEMDEDSEVAFRSVKYLLIYPLSFFLGVIFTESLFLALSLGVVYALRKEKWLLAGLISMFAVLTRVVHGNFLIVIFLVEFIIAKNVAEKVKDRQWKIIISDFLRSGICVLFILLGDFIYLLLNKLTRHDWVAFMAYKNEKWYHHFLFFPNNLKEMVKIAFTYNPSDNLVLWGPAIVSFFFVAILLCISFKKLRLSYWIYLYFYLFSTYCVYWLISGARYMVGAFPVFIILALLSKKRLSSFILTFLSISLLIFYTLVFTYGSYLM